MIKQRRASLALCVRTSIFIGLLVLLIEPQSVQAQWTTNGNNVNNTNAGNVGVGTTAPSTKLEVVGNINAKLAIGAPATTDVRHIFNGASAWLGQDATNGELNFGHNLYYNYGFKYRVTGTAANIRMYLGAFQFQTAGTGSANGAISWTDRMVILANGNVGIGTTVPVAKLDVAGAFNAASKAIRINSSDLNGYSGQLVFGVSPTAAGNYDAAHIRGENSNNTANDGGLLNFQTAAPDASHTMTTRMTINDAGNVGIGTALPTARLHVVGSGYITQNLTVEGNIAAKYQDVAEWVPTTHALSAGTVVTLDPTKSNHVEASSLAYDTRVAGVISAQPGIVLGEKGENKVLVATTGRVKVKVDASRAPIRIGDLLVTGDTPGVAMKSEPITIGGRQMHSPGTLIGKALEPLEKGRGEILVLLSLQ